MDGWDFGLVGAFLTSRRKLRSLALTVRAIHLSIQIASDAQARHATLNATTPTPSPTPHTPIPISQSTHPPRRQHERPHRAALHDELLRAVEQAQGGLRGDGVALVGPDGVPEALLLVRLIRERLQLGACKYIYISLCVCACVVCVNQIGRRRAQTLLLHTAHKFLSQWCQRQTGRGVVAIGLPAPGAGDAGGSSVAGATHGQTDKRTDGRTHGQTDRWTHGQTDKRTGGHTPAFLP